MSKEIPSTDVLKARSLKEEEHLIELIRDSKIVFIGTVTELGPPPSFWSGRFPSYQTVTYHVEEILKGKKVPEITVAHVIVSNSKTARADEPGLSPTLFHKESRLIVIAVQTDQNEWRSMDENLSAVAYSEEALQKIKKALGS